MSEALSQLAEHLQLKRPQAVVGVSIALGELTVEVALPHLLSFVDFLKTDPAKNVETRQRRAELVDGLIDELLQFTAELRTIEPGWSQSPECWLSLPERHWLDPEGVAAACTAAGRPLPTDTAERISDAFALWLNARLRETHSREQALPMGDPEFLAWRRRMLEQIEADERGDRDDD